MDRLERPLVNLPLLLDPSSYVPDTVDLTDDALARQYWLTCFEEALDGVRLKTQQVAPMGLWATWAAPGLSWLHPSKGQQGRRQKRAGTFSRGHVVLVRKIVLSQAGYIGVRPRFREAFL